jgi:formate hydrogenlyase subunit 6/NADH:ubiquinone oxidoreductase subunit I
MVGMKVTFRHLFMPTITVQYPHETLKYPERARAALVNNIDICNGCSQCARACPVNIIHVETVKALKEEDLGLLPDGKPKRLHVVRFDVDMSKCVFCGLCVEACPTGAIHWESPHQPVFFSRSEAWRRWSKYSAEDRKRLLERDAAAKAAAKAAAPAAPAAHAAAPAAPKDAAPHDIPIEGKEKEKE